MIYHQTLHAYQIVGGISHVDLNCFQKRTMYKSTWVQIYEGARYIPRLLYMIVIAHKQIYNTMYVSLQIS